VTIASNIGLLLFYQPLI